MNLADAVFFMIAALTLAAAAGVVLSSNIIHSALFLILTFLGVAGIYFTLDATFLALVQVLVYAGAVAVLIIFAIMLVMSAPAHQSNRFQPNRVTLFLGTLLAGLLTATLVYIVLNTRPVLAPVGPPGADMIGILANLMLGRYVVAFEAAAVLLLLAVVGAIILARGVEEK